MALCVEKRVDTERCLYILRKVMGYAVVISNLHRKQMYTSGLCVDGYSYPFFSFHASFYPLPFPSVSLEFYLHKLLSPVSGHGDPLELWLLHMHCFSF